MDMMDQFLVTRVKYKKKRYLNNYLEKFFYNNIALTFSLIRTAFRTVMELLMII